MFIDHGAGVVISETAEVGVVIYQASLGGTGKAPSKRKRLHHQPAPKFGDSPWAKAKIAGAKEAPATVVGPAESCASGRKPTFCRKSRSNLEEICSCAPRGRLCRARKTDGRRISALQTARRRTKE
ncbi:MAG: hypothetical protein ACLRRF_08705 [Clostridium fessum]